MNEVSWKHRPHTRLQPYRIWEAIYLCSIVGISILRKVQILDTKLACGKGDDLITESHPKFRLAEQLKI